MPKKAVFPGNKPINRPYSPGIESNGFLFISGQLALAPDGKLIRGDVRAAARQCLENMVSVLKAGGRNVGDLVKVTILLKNMSDFDAVNQVYSEFLKDTVLPARSCVQVAALPLDADIEIEAIACSTAQ